MRNPIYFKQIDLQGDVSPKVSDIFLQYEIVVRQKCNQFLVIVIHRLMRRLGMFADNMSLKLGKGNGKGH